MRRKLGDSVCSTGATVPTMRIVAGIDGVRGAEQDGVETVGGKSVE